MTCIEFISLLLARADGIDAVIKARSPSPTVSSLPEDAPHAKILRLLRVLHKLNTLESERSAFVGDKRTLPESAFVNNKLTAKLTRQLEEPMIVARWVLTNMFALFFTPLPSPQQLVSPRLGLRSTPTLPFPFPVRYSL